MFARTLAFTHIQRPLFNSFNVLKTASSFQLLTLTLVDTKVSLMQYISEYSLLWISALSAIPNPCFRNPFSVLTRGLPISPCYTFAQHWWIASLVNFYIGRQISLYYADNLNCCRPTHIHTHTQIWSRSWIKNTQKPMILRVSAHSIDIAPYRWIREKRCFNAYDFVLLKYFLIQQHTTDLYVRVTKRLSVTCKQPG